jgi:uncharacterized protein (TIGR02271 family)
MTDELTHLVCLFHHQDQAAAATEDLYKQGIPPTSIAVIGAGGPQHATGSALDEFGIPARDRQHLLEGIRNGGVVVAVSAVEGHVSAVEKIFGSHKATKIDEELAVGKRTVDQGGVRVYRRVIEIPVEESINLREEHVVVERNAVDRPVTDADLALQGNQVFELTETAEEAVVGKTAHVVEEVVVGKTASERTERIHDTVRHTEVEIEEIQPESDLRTPVKTN